MYSPIKIFIHPGLLALTFIFLAGCATTSPPTSYYLLTPEPQIGTERILSKDEVPLVISLGPVQIPAYLDRPQIVTRLTEHRLRLKNFAHWAEPFQSNFTRVLAQNLSSQFKRAQVVVFPEKSQDPVTHRIPVQILRFDADQSGNVILHVTWSLVDKNTDKVLKRKNSDFRRVVAGKDEGGTVAAMSGLVGEFSLEIGEALDQVFD